MRPSPAPVRSRTRGARTGTGPRPVTTLRSGRCPWRTRRWRPSWVCLSAWLPRKAATSASTACASSARAPSRKTSLSGSENAPGWISLTTLSWLTAYHSFGGEVEARTPHDTPPQPLTPSPTSAHGSKDFKLTHYQSIQGLHGGALGEGNLIEGRERNA